VPATSLLLTAALAAGSITWSTANSVSTGDQNAPAVATNRTGGVAVAWVDDRNTADPHSEIHLRYYQDGAPVYELGVSPGGTGANWKHVTPDVGLDDRGNAVVVWADDPDGNGYRNVPYRIVSPAGTVLAAGRANADATGDQIAPRVAVDPDGTPADPSAVAFTVVWQDVQASTVTVRAAGYTGRTTKTYEKRASQAAGAHRDPDVAVSAAGDATVVWAEDADANGQENVGLTRLARADGAVQLGPRAVNVYQGGRQTHPAVAANTTGATVVAWESDHTGSAGVWARSFTTAGTARHDEVPASVAAGAAAPSVGVDDQGFAVVGWTDHAADGMLRGLNPDGTATGRLPAQVLAWRPQGRQDQFTLAVSPWSEVAVAYTDDSDGNGSAQILLGIGATNDDGTWPEGTAAVAAG
jgi:hypothetical protein